MEPTPIRRRTVLAAGAVLGAASLTGLGAGSARADQHRSGWGSAPVQAATGFLAGVTDAYRSSGPRLAQSYQDASGLGDVAFVYDNAVTAITLLAAGDVRHARAIGDALLFAQAHDETFSDYRLRQAYHANTFVTSVAGHDAAHFAWEFGLTGSAVGDLAWVGIAFAHLAHRTGAKAYRDGALAIGRWIQANTASASGLGGYTFGATAGLEGHKSAEHNVDLYAFFRMLATLTGHPVWRDRADHAWAFVTRVWDASAGHFYTGSDDGASVNTTASQWPLDVQTWSWLAARKNAYAGALDWARTALATTDTPERTNSALTGDQRVSGVTFSSGSLTTDTSRTIAGLDYTPKPDASAVWLEGTGQLAAALRDRGRAGDAKAADALLGQLRTAQSALGGGQLFGGRRIDGGLVAATSPLDTGFGFGYYPNLHVGATAWFVLAATGTNPYRLG